MFIQNIIIGAGPAGLQLGYFFKTSKLEYKIFEKTGTVASFFTKYPLSGKLISINKKYTGSDNPDFNLRHDWNSLLSDSDTKFNEYSEDYYPNRNDLVDYLKDFSVEHELNIQFLSNVMTIQKKEKTYVLTVRSQEKEEEYECERLIVATGLSQPVFPNVVKKYKREIKHYGQFNKNEFLDTASLEMYKNKSVLLIGGGNASFELGNILNPLASSVAIVGRRKDWALSSHYTGDIRSIYLPFMDTFLLKSLNAVEIVLHPTIHISQETELSKYTVSYICSDKECTDLHPMFSAQTSDFDHIIFCTGWKFDSSIFNFDLEMTDTKKYPAIKKNYESKNNERLYFIGSLMHSLDYKQSSGGFIHGFRYLIKNFMHMNYSLDYELNTFQINDELLSNLAKHILYKINFSSAMYQMYGKICDFFFFDLDKEHFIYYNNIVIGAITNKYISFNGAIGFIVTLEYGKERVTDIQKLGIKVSSIGSESKSTLLHPVITIVKNDLEIIDIVHFDEDIFANYQNESMYYFKIMRTLHMFM